MSCQAFVVFFFDKCFIAEKDSSRIVETSHCTTVLWSYEFATLFTDIFFPCNFFFECARAKWEENILCSPSRILLFLYPCSIPHLTHDKIEGLCTSLTIHQSLLILYYNFKRYISLTAYMYTVS